MTALRAVATEAAATGAAATAALVAWRTSRSPWTFCPSTRLGVVAAAVVCRGLQGLAGAGRTLQGELLGLPGRCHGVCGFCQSCELLPVELETPIEQEVNAAAPQR